MGDQPGGEARQRQCPMVVGERADARRARVGLPMGRPHALHAPALLIDEHRRIRAADDLAKRGSQRMQLRRILDVALEEDQPPGLALPNEGALVGTKNGPGAAADERKGHGRLRAWRDRRPVACCDSIGSQQATDSLKTRAICEKPASAFSRALLER